ncbi:MAG: hypothetical protein IJ193_04660 [Bacilli bacterium]|nr:hypothetical protein [Bacilli bacterium]
MEKNELSSEEKKDKLLLSAENVIGYTATVSFLGSIFGASYLEMSDFVRAVVVVSGSVILAVGVGYCLKIEKEAGYYKCSKCGYEHVPEKYLDVFFAPHLGRTRYMKCPECEKKSWQKKVLTKTKKDIK